MKKFLISFVLTAVMLSPFTAGAASFNDIDTWAGSGGNSAAMVVHWSAPEVFNKTSMPAPVADVSMAWGFRFDGEASAEDMMQAVAAADPRLYLFTGGQPGLGMAILGIGYDLDGDGQFGLSNGATTYTDSDFANGILADRAYTDGDAFMPTDSGDLYWGGWYGANWELWHEQGGNGGFANMPERGGDDYFTPDPGSFGFSGSHGDWAFSGMGISGISLEDGSWIGWSVAAGGLDMENFGGEGTQAYLNNKQAPKSFAASPVPVPGTLGLLAAGLAGLTAACRRKE